MGKMNKKLVDLIGTVLWVLFVHIIAPDLSFVRSFFAIVVGWLAIQLIVLNTPYFIERLSREGKLEKAPDE
jgi:hypothetical protein